ncbi:hypothetical protein B7767_40025 [Streptomyces sp. 13-12-16]|nr:hypothetical protein B7767_40025 [Streptomyces sp. 13-12-16]
MEDFVSHHNARLTMHGRQLLIEHVRAGCSIAHVAAEMGTAAPPTSRYAAGGPKTDKGCTTAPPPAACGPTVPVIGQRISVSFRRAARTSYSCTSKGRKVNR